MNPTAVWTPALNSTVDILETQGKQGYLNYRGLILMGHPLSHEAPVTD